MEGGEAVVGVYLRKALGRERHELQVEEEEFAAELVPQLHGTLGELLDGIVAGIGTEEKLAVELGL